MPTVLLVALVACHGSKDAVNADSGDTDVASALAPLEANTAPDPSPSGDDPHPEQISVVSGTTSDYAWAHGKAYVHASLVDTWKALEVGDVDVDRRRVVSWSIDALSDPTYADIYVIHNESVEILTVDFDITWRHGAIDGTADAPTKVGVRYDKTDGTTLISLLTGSIVAYEVGDGVTELELEEHLQTPQSGPADVEQVLKDLHASVVAQVHGDPLPTY